MKQTENIYEGNYWVREHVVHATQKCANVDIWGNSQNKNYLIKRDLSRFIYIMCDYYNLKDRMFF